MTGPVERGPVIGRNALPASIAGSLDDGRKGCRCLSEGMVLSEWFA